MRFTLRGVVITLVALFVAIWLLGLIYGSVVRGRSYEEMVVAGFEATIEPTHQTINALGGKDMTVTVLVHNVGTATWGPKAKDHTIGLGMFRQTLANQLMGREGHGNDSQRRAHPEDYYFGGGKWLATVHFTAPICPGTYQYRLQMVDEKLKSGTDEPESGRWFGNIAEVTVVVPDSVVAAGSG